MIRHGNRDLLRGYLIRSLIVGVVCVAVASHALSAIGASLSKLSSNGTSIEIIDSAENGDIVVAVINDNEVTLKKLKKDKDKIFLIPANDNYKIQSFSSNEIKIQGKLKGIIRSY